MRTAKIGNSILINEDCLKAMEFLIEKGIKVDAIITDPPYGTTACKWDSVIPPEPMWDCLNKLLNPQGSVLLFTSGLFTPRIMLSNINDFKYRWVWVKNNSTNFVHAKNRPMTKSEDILVFSKAPMGHASQLGNKRMTYNPQGLIPCNKVIKAGKGRFGTVAGVRPSHKEEFVREYTNYPSDVLFDFPEDVSTKKLHPTQKPVALLEYLVKTYTNENEIVLDFTMGSGTTGVACQNTKRRFIGIEFNPEKDKEGNLIEPDKYFKVAVKRLQDNLAKGEEEANGK